MLNLTIVFGVFVLETKEFENVWISVLLIGTFSALRADSLALASMFVLFFEKAMRS